MAEEGPDEVEVERTGSVSRRTVLGAGLAGGLAAGAGTFDPALAHGGHPSGKDTTLARTLLRGTPGAGGYRKIVVGPGEPHLVRHELLLRTARGHGGPRPRPLIALGQLTDQHVLDAQSPARVEFLDRYNDPDSPFAPFLPFQSCLPGPGDAHAARRGCDGPGPAPGTAGPRDRAAPVLRDHHR